MAAPVGTKTKLTWEDYVGFPEDGQRHEIIDGDHSVAASPFLMHQGALAELLFQLYAQIRRQGKGAVYPAPTAVQLSPHDIVEPDLLVVLSEHTSYLTEPKVNGPPDLVVEILSPSSRRKDRDLKLRLYQRAGVGEYWIVDPQSRQVERYRRDGDLLVAAGIFSDRIAFAGLPGVVVDLVRVWEEAGAGNVHGHD